MSKRGKFFLRVPGSTKTIGANKGGLSIVQKDIVYSNLSKDTNRLSERNFKRIQNIIDKGSNKKTDIHVGYITSFDKDALSQHGIPESINGHFIVANGVAHAKNHHGINAKLRDYEYPVTTEDINKIPEILKAPDSVTAEPYLTSTQKRKVIKYEKVMDGKKYIYLETYNPKEKRLEMHDMYINKL